MADLTTLTAELAGMKQKMVDRLVAQGDETIQPDDTMQTIVDHFDNLRTKIVNQDKEITANGEYTADEGYTGLGKVTVDVKAEPVPKYGATIDTFLGNVDANGLLLAPTGQYDLVFDGVKVIGIDALKYAFYSRTGIRSVDLSSLQTVGSTGLYYAFERCGKLTSVDLRSLTTVDSNGMYDSFKECVALTSVDLRSLTTVGGTGMYSAFYYCSKLTSANVSSLQTIASSGLYYTFAQCPKLSKMYFPSLVEVQADNSLNYCFYGCTALTEIHFRADMQATVEGLTGYSSKFGATNATIYFDLIGTITVNGVAYARNEPNSIYVEYDKTYVAWADESGNIVYTTAGAEPAVGTVVYSDEGTTQAGTVSAVA